MPTEVIRFYPKKSYLAKIGVGFSLLALALGWFFYSMYTADRIPPKVMLAVILCPVVVPFLAVFGLASIWSMITDRPSLEADQDSLQIIDILGRRTVRRWSDVTEITQVLMASKGFRVLFLAFRTNRPDQPEVRISDGLLDRPFADVLKILIKHTGASRVPKVPTHVG